MKKLFLALLVLCASCVTPSVIVRQNTHIERLGIYLETGEHAIPIISNQFDTALDDFIETHNATPVRPFELFRAQANDSSTLRIKLLATRFVSPGDQTAGVFVSVAGLSLPFIMLAADLPILIFFYYFPKVKSIAELSLSEDINGETQLKKETILTSPGFLKSPEKQVKAHAVSFDRFLKLLVTQVARQTARKKANTVARQDLLPPQRSN